MPNYGYGDGLAHGYMSAGDDIGKGITAAYLQSKKQADSAEGVQALLDISRRFTIPDVKTGKPKPILSDEHYQYIKGLIDQKKYKAAGAAEAALGIGKDMIPRWQAAAAKQAAAYQKAQETQQQMLQGPVMATTPQGERAMWNPHTGSWQAPPSLPRNVEGQTTEEQKKFHESLMNKQQADQNVLRTGFAAGLKAMNTTPQDLYDTAKVQPMVFVPGRGFFPVANYMPDESKPRSTDPNTLSADPSMTAPDATHVRIGYEPPSTEKFVRGDKKGLPVKPGNPGHVITIEEFNALRDSQAKIAGPNAELAWRWMNTSPEATATDFNGNPWTEDSIKQYNEVLPRVRKRFQSDVAKGFEVRTQAPPQDTEGATQGTTKSPTFFDLQGYPKAEQPDSSVAQAQAPAASFPITSQPVTTVPDQQQSGDDF